MATVRIFPFELEGADGGPLRGEARSAAPAEGRPAVVVCHGFKGFKDWGFFPHLAARLARAGLTVVTFNFSGSGVGPDGETFSEPERFGHATFSGDQVDLDRICTALAGHELTRDLAPPSQMGLFGHSRGGGAAILYAAEHASCRCLVTWAAIAQAMRWDARTVQDWRASGRIDVVNQRTGQVLPLYTDVLDDLAAHHHHGLDILQAAGRVAVPWLIVHGEADESVPESDARALYRAARHEIAELQVIAGGTHTFGARHPWDGGTAELETAMDATVGWFSRHLW